MTGLLIKVEHHPENDPEIAWCASMHRDLPAGTEHIMGTYAWAATRDDAVAATTALYEKSQEAEPVEWLTYQPSEIEPQSLKAS